MQGLTGKNVIVTGAAGGIGRALCLRLAHEGVNVGVFDIDDAGAQQTQQLVEDVGGRANAFCIDITDYEAIANAVNQFVDQTGEVNGLVNNAGWDLATKFLSHDDRSLWDKVIQINLYGPLNLCHIVGKRMANGAGGRIVNVASDAGRVGSSGEAVYSACKGGLIAFAKTLARENAGKNITVNTVCPGPTNTALFASFDPTGKLAAALTKAVPLGRVGEPEDYPGIVSFLLSDDAAYITGQTISVSGGLTMHG
jgi:2-hydroxycyclohexanecarboxyl-CoA dehydrogenase